MYYLIALGVALLIGLVMWKFFNQYLKYYIIAVVLMIPLVYMLMPTAEVKDPIIGKLAYSSNRLPCSGTLQSICSAPRCADWKLLRHITARVR